MYDSCKFKNRSYIRNSKSRQKINGDIYCQDLKLINKHFFMYLNPVRLVNHKLIRLTIFLPSWKKLMFFVWNKSRYTTLELCCFNVRSRGRTFFYENYATEQVSQTWIWTVNKPIIISDLILNYHIRSKMKGRNFSQVTFCLKFFTFDKDRFVE